MSKIIVFVLLLFFGVGWTASAHGGQVVLAWDANTEPDLAGYKMYYGQTTRVYGPPTPIDVGNVLTYTVTGLTEGETYYFAVTAYDTFGNESGYSNEVIYTVPLVDGATPATLAVVSGFTWREDTDRNGILDTATATFNPPAVAGSIPLWGDLEGNGIRKKLVFDGGKWYWDKNGNGAWNGEPTDKIIYFGLPGDKPLLGKWASGMIYDCVGVLRGTKDIFLDWNGSNNWDGTSVDRWFTGFAPPSTSSVLKTGDWDGDGKDEMAWVTNGEWRQDRNGDYLWNGEPTDKVVMFGLTGDIFLTGDWPGIGKDCVGVKRSNDILLDYSCNGNWDGTTVDRYYPNFTAGITNPVVVVK